MAENTETSTTPPAGKRPILVVDDEPEMLYSLRNLLRREFEVYTARSGEEGIEILQQHEIHLVMTDQRMPMMTGVELLHRLKTEHPGAMRLIFTGYADIKTVIDAINQGNVFRYITKPWDPEELLGALREAGQRYDQIVDRNHLLSDLRNYEQRCVAYAGALLDGTLGTLTVAGTSDGKRLLSDGRALAARLDKGLEATLKEPMC
ncbi:MAG TPA: response regulator [Tepidisphaeraceae bacterium]|jgi:DNA-binding NtrC family response regulator|nr:response regulator [Tepidisphaeraceae bacterium]